MMKRHFLLPMLLGALGAFWACSPSGGTAFGPGSETTNGIAMVGGEAAPFARVAIRSVDHMVDKAIETNSIVVDADTLADSAGRFSVRVPEDGEYRLTVYHAGYAFSKIVSLERTPSEETGNLGEVQLTATAVMKGEVDIPKGSGNVWVGILGTDILVPTDANGVFVMSSIPANDSLQLYFVSEEYDSVLIKKDIYLEPSESAYENYKAPVEVRKDSSDSSDAKQIVVLQADGKAAAHAMVALRKADYMPEKFALQNNLITQDEFADENGVVDVVLPESGSYRLTATRGENTFSKVYSVEDLSKLDTLKLSASATVTSKVTLNAEDSFAWVGVYGLDIMVKTNDIGVYVLPSLPVGDSLDLYFVRADGDKPFVEWSLSAAKEGTNYLMPSTLLYDFEEDRENWYMDVDTLYKGSTFKFGTGSLQNDKDHELKDHLILDEDRGDSVFHTFYELADNPYAWVLLGMKLDEIKNFAAIDSVEFYAKGNGEVRVALENWTDYTTKSAKAASGWKKVSSKWTRMVVKPSELCVNSSEKWSCDNAWNSVKNQVKQVHFFFAAGNEIFIDDVKIYGALF